MINIYDHHAHKTSRHFLKAALANEVPECLPAHARRILRCNEICVFFLAL